jgi:HPt (histidine-containing phosphotransfer) domain-containing protein
MRARSCDDDRAAIGEEAHTLKGASGTLGMHRLCELARQLEHDAPAVLRQNYAAQVEHIDTAFMGARVEVERILADTDSAAERTARSGSQ